MEDRGKSGVRSTALCWKLSFWTSEMTISMSAPKMALRWSPSGFTDGVSAVEVAPALKRDLN